MARRKFRYSQRFDHAGNLSHQEYIIDQPAQVTTKTELLRLIRGGEDSYLELKVKLSNPEKITQGIVALANTDGGTIIFGVSDTLRIEGVSDAESVRDELARICRNDIVPPVVPLIDLIAFDSGKRIVVLDIDTRKRPHRTADGRFFMRLGAEKREVSREELSVWLDELRPLGYENIPLFNGNERDFDDGLLWTFAGSFTDGTPSINMYQTAEFLKKDLLLAVGNGEDFFPTVAAVVLFGRSDRMAELFPRSAVMCTRFSGEPGREQLVERIELHGNLLNLYEAVMRFIVRYVDLRREKPKKLPPTDSMHVRPRAAYHQFAVREAVANMLIHRDLAFRDIPTRVNIYDETIEFINARRTNGFVPPASRAIRYGITQRVNPQIAAIATRREYGANIPRGGLPMILKQAAEFSERRVELTTANDEFKLKMYGG